MGGEKLCLSCIFGVLKRGHGGAGSPRNVCGWTQKRGHHCHFHCSREPAAHVVSRPIPLPAINDQSEAAISVILVSFAYEELLGVRQCILIVSCRFFYVCLQVLFHNITIFFWKHIIIIRLQRVVAKVFLQNLQIMCVTSGWVSPSSTQLFTYAIIT